MPRNRNEDYEGIVNDDPNWIADLSNEEYIPPGGDSDLDAEAERLIRNHSDKDFDPDGDFV